MEKIEIGTKVSVNLNSSDANKLGINDAVFGSGTITGHYSKGHYVKMPEKKTPLAISDKYDAVHPDISASIIYWK